MFAEPSHILNDRKIDPKKALARGGRDPIKKVFVGGLPPEFPLEDIKEYFGKFGKVGTVKVWCWYLRVAMRLCAVIYIYLHFSVTSQCDEIACYMLVCH